MDLLSANERQTLFMIRDKLPRGHQVAADQLLNGIDPTGGLVAIDDQITDLHRQYVVDNFDTFKGV